jgi:hypothetical protein
LGGEKIEDGDDTNKLPTNNGVGGVIVGGVFVDGKTNVKPTKNTKKNPIMVNQ